MRATIAGAACCFAALAAAQPSTGRDAYVPWRASGDAIPVPLSPRAGDPARGARIVADRRTSLCLLCHQGPFPDDRMQGTVAPPLQGAGARWTEGQLRLRVADARALNPDSIMPPFHRRHDGLRVGDAWAGRPILDAQQIEDVVAWLGTLKQE
ncbi:MAG: sulfur oxidation c-type cytochrome SoxX [Lautropia sp.]